VNTQLKEAIDQIALARHNNDRELSEQLFAKLQDDFNPTRAEASMIKTEVFKEVDRLREQV